MDDKDKKKKKKKEGGGDGELSLKQRGEAGSLFPSDLSVRTKALFRQCDFIICETLRGIIFLLNPSLIPLRCGTPVMKHIYHLQNDKRADETVCFARLDC